MTRPKKKPNGEITITFKHPRGGDPFETAFEPSDRSCTGRALLEFMQEKGFIQPTSNHQELLFANERTKAALVLDQPLGEQDIQDGDCFSVALSSAIA
jgi:hypothetical protein